jgi:hypothetical protein
MEITELKGASELVVEHKGGDKLRENGGLLSFPTATVPPVVEGGAKS